MSFYIALFGRRYTWREQLDAKFSKLLFCSLASTEDAEMLQSINHIKQIASGAFGSICPFARLLKPLGYLLQSGHLH